VVVARACVAATFVAVLLSLCAAETVVSASNTVPGSRVTRYVTPITADTLKPASCAGITLTTVVAGVTGTAGADLLLGSAAADTMSAAGGNDCVLGGGGNDSINCGAGTDVAIGGPGTDTFNANCETQIQ
jgi:Ca2+-binding RTX toxin-like protein